MMVKARKALKREVLPAKKQTLVARAKQLDREIRREVGSLGTGAHSVALDDSPPLRPGLYFLRLAQGARVLSTRVAVVQ